MVTSFENHAHFFHIQPMGTGDGLQRLSMVVSLSENSPLELWPLTESIENLLD